MDCDDPALAPALPPPWTEALVLLLVPHPIPEPPQLALPPAPPPPPPFPLFIDVLWDRHCDSFCVPTLRNVGVPSIVLTIGLRRPPLSNSWADIFL